MKIGKPELTVSTYVDSYNHDSDIATGPSKYDKERKVRLKKEIAFMEKNIKNWDNEKAGKHVKMQLEADLERKKNDLKELNQPKIKKAEKKFKLNFA